MTSAPFPSAVPDFRRARRGSDAVMPRLLVATRQSFVNRLGRRIFTIPRSIAQASRPRPRPAAASCDRCPPARARCDRSGRALCRAGACARAGPPPITAGGFPRAPRAPPPSRGGCAGRSPARLGGLEGARLRRPPAARRDHRRRRAERGLDFAALHLAERRFALLREDHRDRLPLAPHQDRVHVHEPGAQLLGHQPPDDALPRPREPHEQDVTLHVSSAAGGVRARSCARYPAKFRRVSLSASPPNFSSSACASTSAIIASAMTPIAGTAVTSERSDSAGAAAPVARSTLRSGLMSVEIGFIATRATSGSPVVIPPSVPPARFVAR